MRSYYGITGTPGTGKKTVAPLVASRLRVPCYSLNDLAVEYGLTTKEGDDLEVDAAELGRRVSASIKGPCLFFGHLFPYAFERRNVSSVVVLRCDPKVLRRRLAKRGYSEGKIAENVEAELIGLISADSMAKFGRGRSWEFDTTRASPSRVASAISGILILRGGWSTQIEWMRSYDSPAKLKSLLTYREKRAE